MTPWPLQATSTSISFGFMAARTRLVVVEIFAGESYAVWSPAAER